MSVSPLYAKSLILCVSLLLSSFLLGCPEETGLNCDSQSELCGSRCVTTDRDPLNCGACDNACATGERCVMGACTQTCPAGQTLCSSDCVDPLTDARHCGDCGQACETGLICTSGQCVTQCAAGLTACDGTCVNVLADADHCGDCGQVCARNETCMEGTCTCTAPLTACAGGCVDTSTAVSDCGQCGMGCQQANEVCSDGMCECPEGTALCPGAGCVDVLNDIFNCGGCGRVCNNTQACVDGTCGPIVQCQPNSVPPPACDVFPVDFDACGVAVETATLVRTATALSAGELRFDIPNLAANQRAVARLNYSARNTSVRTTFRNFRDEVLPDSGNLFIPPPTSNLLRVDIGRGKRLMCANPSEFVIEQGGVLDVEGPIEIETLNGTYNTGAVEPQNATPVPGDPVCNLLCGVSGNFCEDQRHAYEVTIPPGGRLDIEYTSRVLTRVNMASGVSVLRAGDATLLCSVVPATVVAGDWVTRRGRVLNNAQTPLPVILDVLCPAGEFKMAVSTSPTR